MYAETFVETIAKVGTLPPLSVRVETGPKISELVPSFLSYGQAQGERNS
jgi:hypothetical protein